MARTSSPTILPSVTLPSPVSASRLPSTLPTLTSPAPVRSRVSMPLTVLTLTLPESVETSTLPSSHPATSTSHAPRLMPTLTSKAAGTVSVRRATASVTETLISPSLTSKSATERASTERPSSSAHASATYVSMLVFTVSEAHWPVTVSCAPGTVGSVVMSKDEAASCSSATMPCAAESREAWRAPRAASSRGGRSAGRSARARQRGTMGREEWRENGRPLDLQSLPPNTRRLG